MVFASGLLAIALPLGIRAMVLVFVLAILLTLSDGIHPRHLKTLTP